MEDEGESTEQHMEMCRPAPQQTMRANDSRSNTEDDKQPKRQKDIRPNTKDDNPTNDKHTHADRS